jgi:hypothetical protein
MMNASSLASVPWKIIALAFLLSTFSEDVQVVAFAPNANVGRSSKQIPVSSPRLRFGPNKLNSPTSVRSSSSRVSNSSVPSVANADSISRWNLWKDLRNRISTLTSMSADAATGFNASSSAGGVSTRIGSRWMKAAAAFATFLVMRPISAIASGGGMGGGARTTPLPKLEGYVPYYTVCCIHTVLQCIR